MNYFDSLALKVQMLIVAMYIITELENRTSIAI